MNITKIPAKDAIKIMILFGMSGYLAYTILSENLGNYINNSRFVWLTWVAVGLFFVLGVVNVLPFLRPKADATVLLIETSSIMPKSWIVMFICALPLLLGVLIPSQPLDVKSLTGTLSTTVSVSNTTVITRDPLKRNILDWLRAFSLEADKTAFDGTQAQFSGFIYRNPEFPDGVFMVGRFVVACCTADADPIGLPVYAPQADDLAEGQWVEVRGTFLAGEFRRAITPILQVEMIEPIEQPKNSYLYP
ncbi:MAG: TIGR03943 family protein [Phototrophicales bacterium]|nr:MAG: TIGR03943 family protein [Phototrophicales bacterium]